MSKKSVFISFDYDNDLFLKESLIGQSKLADSPFSMKDSSIKEHLTGDWREKAKARMKDVDLVIIMCGEKTHTATGVDAEAKIAMELGKSYFLLHGYSGRTCTRPLSMPNEKVYSWTWENLKILVGGGR